MISVAAHGSRRSAVLIMLALVHALLVTTLVHAQEQNATTTTPPATTAPATSPATQPATAPSDHLTLRDIAYRTGPGVNDDMREFCKLDLHYPAAEKNKGFATILWFHGGGMKGGKRGIPVGMQNRGVAVVGVGYRLAPRAKSPEYIEDAAAAYAWVRNHIEEYGGDPHSVFISGHSAGAFLALMIGLDKHYLEAHGIDANEIAGLAPLSPQVITHLQIRGERKIPQTRPVVDEFAPLYHVRKDAPPILIVTGDRNLEMLGRYEENAYFWRMMKVVGHTQIELVEIEGKDHGKMAAPGIPMVLKFVQKISGKPNIILDP